ncbi:hypothetical protein [Leptolyngbya sp. FACHB-711]|uniref:hypothetical protein n=1 Tax=Leptolyngbya sp. FACHB-711 TaxID=2692813 RepID=UPI001681E096|nr:hypothetical protein [Leptolyngbya sp. FACHB-711]MBD2026808.1 hypothetical protein [Leptolyngbya sp. FACHB-711]
MVIKLAIQNIALTLLSDTDDWCEVELAIRDKVVRLGADQRDIVINRLISGLENEITDRFVGVINGLNVVGILSLFEEHGTIYAGDSGEHRILFFQDSSGALLENVALTMTDREHWLAQLREGMNERES